LPVPFVSPARIHCRRAHWPSRRSKQPADGAWLDAINLPERVPDGDQVRVPYLAAAGAEPFWPAATTSSGSPASPVNLDTASTSELDRPPGIGPSLAQGIID